MTIQWHKVLIYLSMVFLLLFLIKNDYFRLPEIQSPLALTVSLIILFLGFMTSVIPWHYLLAASGFPVSIQESAASVGLYVFTKYIPGKIWTVLAPASFLSKRKTYPLGSLSAISLQAQFISIWTGMVLGFGGLFLLRGLQLLNWTASLICLLLTIAVFSQKAHRATEKLLGIVLKKQIQIPKIGLRSALSPLMYFLLTWLLWGCSFYFFICAFHSPPPQPSVVLGFPLAASMGIVTLIAPGGLGVREGVAVGYLHLAQMPLKDAFSLTTLFRGWFLIGELFFFTIGLFAYYRLRH